MGKAILYREEGCFLVQATYGGVSLTTGPASHLFWRDVSGSVREGDFFLARCFLWQDYPPVCERLSGFRPRWLVAMGFSLLVPISCHIPCPWLGQRSLRPMGTINFQAYVICYGGVPRADTIWPHIMSLWWRGFLELVWKEKLVLVTYFQRWSPLISLSSVAKITWGCYWGSCSIWGRNEPTWFPCVTRLGVNYDRPGSTSVGWEILRCPADVPFLKSMVL